MSSDNSFDDILRRGPVVINLDRSTDRWDLFRRQGPVADGSIVPTRFPAVDGRDPEQLKSVKAKLGIPPTRGVWRITRGHTGCGLSHMLLMQKMVDENLPFLWVVEDDAHFCPNFVAQFRRYYDELTPKDWEYVAIGSSNGMGPVVPAGGPDARVSKTPMWGMHCYLISLEGAKKFLGLVRKVGFWYVDVLVYFMMSVDAQLLERASAKLDPKPLLEDPFTKRFYSFLRANGNFDSVLAEAPSRWRLRFVTYFRPETTRDELVAAGSRVGILKAYGLAFQSDATSSETEHMNLRDFLLKREKKNQYAIRHVREFEAAASSSKRAKSE